MIATKSKTPPAKFIRQIRVSRGLNQTEFAQRMGVSQKTISDWERGLGLRSVQIAMKLLRILAK